MDPLSNVRFVGTHYGDRTDDDVTIVEIYDSNTPFVIQQIFTQFRNVQGLVIRNSNLQSIKISPAVQLHHVITSGNNITKFESDSFHRQTTLYMLSCTNDNIAEIDETAFDDLHSLVYLLLDNNRIREIKPRHLLLPNVEYFYIERNLLTSIDYGFVKGIPNARFILMDGNYINRIHPNAFDGYKNSHGYHLIALRMNQCVDGIFSLVRYEDSPYSWTEMNELLEECFNNYNSN